MNRNLDEVYFRVERDGEWQNICFTDLTDEEIQELFYDSEDMPMSVEWWRSLAMALRSTIRNIGETLDIVRGE